MPGPWRLRRSSTPNYANISFNLNRDARPLATPPRWFPHRASKSFNLNRDARPLATWGQAKHKLSSYKFQSQPRCQAPGDQRGGECSTKEFLFQSQPRCQAPGDLVLFFRRMTIPLFQSQPRCQAPGDPGARALPVTTSICFNLNRDARPLATSIYYPSPARQVSFNLNRDARPLATNTFHGSAILPFTVSISTEMPGPWRLRRLETFHLIGTQFQSQPRCQAPGDEVRQND